MGAPAPVLVVEDVEKTYGAAKALCGVSFTIGPGEVLGLLGPNGAGKTSLIRMLLDLTRPDAGRVEVLGQPPSSRMRERIGYLPEERGLYPKQRVVDVLSYLVSLSGLSAAEARARSEGWLDRVGLSPWRKRRIRELSKGMQQKVQLGAAVLHEPDLVILDEPFTGLDPVNRRLVSDVVREMRDRGAGVIISTHLMDQVEQLCDSVVLLRQGHLLLEGPVLEVRRRHAAATVTVGAEAGWQTHPAIAPLLQAVQPRGELLEVTLAQDAEPGSFLTALVEAGISVEHFSRTLPSLDDVFVLAVAKDHGDPEAARREIEAGTEATA
jgi:ABC-2 type transport system ATP-binding protein